MCKLLFNTVINWPNDMCIARSVYCVGVATFSFHLFIVRILQVASHFLLNLYELHSMLMLANSSSRRKKIVVLAPISNLICASALHILHAKTSTDVNYVQLEHKKNKESGTPINYFSQRDYCEIYST